MLPSKSDMRSAYDNLRDKFVHQGSFYKGYWTCRRFFIMNKNKVKTYKREIIVKLKTPLG